MIFIVCGDPLEISSIEFSLSNYQREETATALLSLCLLLSEFMGALKNGKAKGSRVPYFTTEKSKHTLSDAGI